MELLGKTVVVTGGGRGLGRAYCESLAQQGANVVAADIRDTGSTVEAVKTSGGQAIGVHLDVTDASSCNDMAFVANVILYSNHHASKPAGRSIFDFLINMIGI